MRKKKLKNSVKAWWKITSKILRKLTSGEKIVAESTEYSPRLPARMIWFSSKLLQILNVLIQNHQVIGLQNATVKSQITWIVIKTLFVAERQLQE